MDCYWIHQTDATFRELRRVAGRVAMIPLGSIESHGPHLPLGCDPIKTDNLVRHILRHEPVAVLPTIPYTFVAAARALPGAVHIRSELLIDFVENICDEIHRNGFDKIILLHGHGGNTALHTMFCNRMHEREKPYVVYSLSAQGDKWSEMLAMTESKENGHACEWETSMAMVACPGLVRLDLLGDKTFPAQREPDVRPALTAADWIAKYPEMCVGKPQLASVEKGEKFLAMVTGSIVEIIRRIKRDEDTPRVLREYARKAHSVHLD